MKTIKHTIYVIRFSSIENKYITEMDSNDGKKLFTKLNDVENLLECHGFEKLADSGNDEEVISKYVNLNHHSSIAESYFDAPRAEIVKQEIEFEVND